MPAVVPTAVGFVAGLVAGLLFSWGPWPLAPLGALSALLCWRQRRAMSVALAALAAGAVWGAGARQVRAADCRLHWRDGQRLSIVAEPRDLAPAGERARRFTVLEPAHCAGAIIIVLPPGDSTRGVLAVTGTWRRDLGFADHAVPLRPERAGKLLAVTARPLPRQPGLRSRLRIGAEQRLARLFGPERWPLAAALTVSPEAALPMDMRQSFRRSGLTHILSISGFHVAILAGALIVVLRACRLAPDVARIAGMVLVAGYVWMLGLPAPAVRSAALIGLWCWARVRQRPPLANGLIAATVLAVSVPDPWSALEPGPWLSFGGVWGCAAASWWWQRLERESRGRALRRAVRWAAPVAVSVGATLATTPVQALVFGTVTPIGVIANITAIPLAAFAVPALALALALALLPGAMPAAELAAGAAGLALDGLEHTAHLAAGASWATFEVGSRLGVAVAVAAAGCWLLRAGALRRPARAVLAARLGMVAAAGVALACWLPGRSSGAADGGRDLALHFLAVGQGDATAIRTPGGRWILIDGGPRVPGQDAGARKVAPFLRRQGVRRLAVVIASHADADHLGGLPAVLEAVSAEVAIEPGAADGRPLYREWLGGVVQGGSRWHAARAGDRLTVDGVTLRVWHPDSATIAERWAPNENSVVVTVEYGAFRALFGGDAGLPMEALRAPAIGDVTLLKVGHHGSRSASGAAWLEALRPELCLIQVGTGNRYGHPDPGVLERLDAAGCRTWRTDRSGDVTLTTDGRTVRVHTATEDTIVMLPGGPQ